MATSNHLVTNFCAEQKKETPEGLLLAEGE